MVQRAALVQDGLVTNVILIDPTEEWLPPDGQQLIRLPDDSVVSPGWTWDVADGFAPPA